MSITMTADDLYDKLELEYKGSQLQPITISIRPVDLKLIGAWAQDPAGWGQRFLQPNPYSSVGAYFIVVFSGYAQGSTLPYLENTKVRMSLGGESNQQTSQFLVQTGHIAILDAEVFVQSLRSVLAIKDLKVGPALLTYAQTLKG